MRTKINDSNFETINDLFRLISRKRMEIKDLEKAMDEHKSKEGMESVKITIANGMSYATSVEILSESASKFVAALIPAVIGILQAEIDGYYEEIDRI